MGELTDVAIDPEDLETRFSYISLDVAQTLLLQANCTAGANAAIHNASNGSNLVHVITPNKIG